MDKKIEKRGGWKERLTGEQRTLIVDMWDSKKFTQNAIAKAARCSRSGVKATLAKAGRMSFFSPATSDKVMSLVNAGLSALDVERETGVPAPTVYSIAHYNKAISVLTPATTPIAGTIAERKKICREWKPGRYMVVADFHILFHDKQIIEQLLATSGDFDGCIIAGDLLDEFYISHFRKELGGLTHSKEVAAGLGIVELLKKRFGRVLIIEGNHEARRFKGLLEAAKGVADLMEEKAPELYKCIENIRHWYFNEIKGIQVHNNWWVNIANGKIIISHPDRFMKVPGQAPAGVLEHFLGHGKAYGLDVPIDTMLQGHTHRACGPTHRLGIWTMELPCCCGVLPYQLSSRASSAGTVDTGFFVLTTRKNGELWYNQSRTYLLENDRKDVEQGEGQRELWRLTQKN